MYSVPFLPGILVELGADALDDGATAEDADEAAVHLAEVAELVEFLALSDW